ncbi:hypothetical protein [Vibrio campbellii]|uniref:hypothetical protein n=1 Tax=Vibrio campbellii TaxID=680 RepID=UPI0003A26CEB|nr:hypothetical protein [Vibrio campbellii]
MNYHTISDLVADYLEGSLVRAAFFSTYSFEPDFFELEIMPLLMSQKSDQNRGTYQPALSTNDAIRWQQLERLMTQRHIDISVVYDPTVYRCERSPRLEVAYNGYSPRKGCQHAKLIAMVLESPDEESLNGGVLFGAGSFNLTRAGWWDNIECGHFVLLTSDWAPKNVCSEIIGALTFYQQVTTNSDTALQKVIEAIESLPKTADDDQLAFYFTTGERSFTDFIFDQGNYSQLEVISPYFAESGESRVITDFLSQFESRRVFLPLDPYDDNRAKVAKDVYEQLSKQDVQWCGWRKKLTKTLVENDVPRALHAKVYRMSSATSVDLFIGSVNFSYKAFQDNVEAGFLIKQCGEARLLSDKAITAQSFDESRGELHGDVDDERSGFPVMNLSYCWKSHVLSLINSCSEWPHPIKLFNSSKEELARIEWVNGESQPQVHVIQDCLEQHLKNSSLVTAASHDGEQQPISRELILSQQNVFARPSVLPPLSLTDLLSIFRGMSSSKMLQVTEHYARLSELASMYSSNEEFTDKLQAESRNFFSEFSEINSAFYHLNQTLCQAREDGDQRTLDYYLLGKQPDSLHGALQLLTVKTEPGKAIAPVIRYLSLISIQDTLQRVEPVDNELSNLVSTAIYDLEESNTLQLTDCCDDPSYNRKFFAWFKREFLSSGSAEVKGDN